MKCIFVDDEPNILNSMKRQLESDFSIETSLSADQALSMIAADPEVAVVVTDYKMPTTNGLEFLKILRKKSPNILSVMLTGVADLKTVMNAVNEGQVFRFMTKPCSPEELTKCLSEALAQYAKEKAERELLENTLAGSVKVLTDILGVIDPIGFENGKSIRHDVREVVKRIEGVIAWETELAAMLLELGTLVIPTPLIVKFRTAQHLTRDEAQLWARVPEVGADLIKQVPRLEGVAEIVRRHRDNYVSPIGKIMHDIPKGARLIRILLEAAKLSEKGLSKLEAIQKMESETTRFDREIIKEIKLYYFQNHFKKDAEKTVVKSAPSETALNELKAGDVVARDIRTKDGIMLAKAGTKLESTLIERIRNYSGFVGLEAPPLIEK